MQENRSIKEILDEYGKYTGLTSGFSMWPLIKNQRDNIIVTAPDGRLKKYDIALFLSEKGDYVLHRVVEVRDDCYVIVGDNCIKKDIVRDEQICGVLAGFYRKGKTYVDCIDGKWQKLYAKIWVALYPARPLLFKAERAAIKIKHRIKKNNG